MTYKKQTKPKNRLPRLINLFSLKLIFILSVLIFTQNVNAQVTWDGGGTTNNFSDADNWSTDSVPGTTQLIFDSTSTKDCVIDVLTNATFNMNAGYTGTITQAVDLTSGGGVNIASGTFNSGSFDLALGVSVSGGIFNRGTGSASLGNFLQTGGTFNGGSGDLTFASFAINGGTFNTSASIFTVNGSFSVASGATFNQSIGTLVLGGVSPSMGVALDNPIAFNNVTKDGQLGFSNPHTLFNNNLIVNGTLNLNDGGFTSGIIQANGNVNIASTFDGGTAGIAFTGTSDQTFTDNGGTDLTGDYTLNKSSGTLNLASDLNLNNGFNFFNFTSGTITTNGNTVNLGTRNVTSGGGYVIGNLRRQFNSNGVRTYDVGTANGYSPVDFNVTARVGNPTLTISANQGAHPNSPFAINALQRYWTLTETGDVTGTLTFNYLQSDVPAFINESDLELRRYTGSGIIFDLIPATLNTTNNTITTDSPISDFSDWTLFPLGPTAASTEVGGKVVTDSGRGIPRAYVSLIDQNGSIRTTMTNPFGYFKFRNVLVGESYTVNVRHKTYEFVNPTQIINVSEAITDLNFTAENTVSRNGLATISGKVLNHKNYGIPDLRIKLFGGELKKPIYVSTDKDGKYTFENVKVGNSYILSVENLKLKIKEPTKSIFLTDSIEGFDFKTLN